MRYILLLLLSGLSYLDGCVSEFIWLEDAIIGGKGEWRWWFIWWVENGEDDHSMEEDDDVGSDEGDNEEDDVVEKAKNLMI